jgi:hypothetical protein
MLKIKNIQNYRTYYKDIVRQQPARDENFIGNFYTDNAGKKQFGWFDLYHGDKEGFGNAEAGIENFLQSFLDMARDGQAVYEFLQNAVDAGSTHFTMIWGKEEEDGCQYLMVANNGEMFSFNSIRSILNVGSSTKSSDSQTIGKFGIGFKLAHRLVGKDNGLHELIHENSGPILFSWKNYDLKELADYAQIEPNEIEFLENDGHQHSIIDDHAWLFKILVTCFPCLPENEFVSENPILLNSQTADESPFSLAELNIMRKWVSKSISFLNKDTYKEGSLFFLRLGKGKEADLADKNLREGVRFSLAVLNKTADSASGKSGILETVQLNEFDPIRIPDLQFLRFNVSKSSDLDDYIYVRFGVKTMDQLQKDQLEKFNREADIDVLIGYKKYNEIGNTFEGAPNFYLYFPLSEEVHNFNYILHCNAFYKGSSRTFLHKGTKDEEGINERLLTLIANRMFQQMKTLADSVSSADRFSFLNLYAAILTSGESDNQERHWIREPYLEVLSKRLKETIPVIDADAPEGFSVASSDQDVYVKLTEIDIRSEWLPQPINWFYWDSSFPEFQTKAIAKLQLQTYGIVDLLQITDIHVHINAWLNSKESKINILLTELSVAVAKELKTESLIANLVRLNILSFDNEKTISLLELDELQDDGYLIVRNNLSEIVDLLKRCDFKVTKVDFNEFNFIEEYNSYLNPKSQLRSHLVLTRLFSQFIKSEVADKLNADEKFKIFCAFRDLNADNKGDRIDELKLYRNINGETVYTKNLLFETDQLWLKGFCIDQAEYLPELKAYLTSNDRDIYESVIYPFWPQIAEIILNQDNDQIFEAINKYFELYKPSGDSEKLLLSDHQLIFFDNTVLECANPVFSKKLSELQTESYHAVQHTLKELFELHIPDAFFLKYAELEYFKLPEKTAEFLTEQMNVTPDQLSLVLEFCQATHCDFFGQLTVRESNGIFQIQGKGEEEQFYSENTGLIDYANTFYPDVFVFLPNKLKSHYGLLSLHTDGFASHLIEMFTEEDSVQELALISAILKEGSAVKMKMLEKLTFIPLDAEWKEDASNAVYLGLLAGVLAVDAEALIKIEEKLVINNGEQTLEMKEIDHADDVIKLKRGDKEVKLSQAEILDFEGKEVIRVVKDFARECVDRKLLSDDHAALIFKLSASGVTDDLVKRFKSALGNTALKNAHQLAFVLVSGKFTDEEINAFKVGDYDGKDQTLTGPWIFSAPPNEVYNNAYVLGELYADLPILLSLGFAESFRYTAEANELIFPHYLFINGCEIDVLDKDAETINLLNELLKGFKATPTESLSKEQSDQQWKNVLKFEPKQVVLTGPTLEEENLPEDVAKWYSVNDGSPKLRLLIALGSNGPGSRIVQIRKLLQNPALKDIEFKEIHSIPDTLLDKTLKLFSQDELKLTINQNDERLKIIESITGILIENEYENFPILVLNDDDTVSLCDPDQEHVYVLNGNVRSALADQPELQNLYGLVNIAWPGSRHSDHLLTSLTELPITENIFVEGLADEHTEPFYKRWSLQYGIILKKTTALKAKIYVNLEEEQVYIGTLTPDQQYLIDDEKEIVEICYNQQLTFEQLLEQMEKESDYTDAIEELKELRDQALANFYHMLSMADDSADEASIYRALKQALEAANSENERNDLIEKLQTEPDFSYEWFKTFLEYLLTFDQVAGTTSQRSLSFQKVARYEVEGSISEKYFLLTGSSGLIPVNVDTFTDFRVTINFSNQPKVAANIDAVSSRGQDMLIYCSEGLSSQIIDNLDHIVNVSISFTPSINLLRQLYNAFSNIENLDPWTDIMEALPAVELIYGPPGTGKTTSIRHLLSAERNLNPHFKALILTPTNKAADVLVKKIVLDDPEIRPIRVGSATDPELESLDPELYQAGLTSGDIDYYDVIAATVHRLPYFKVSEGYSDYLFRLQDHWDIVIIDEASMVSLPYLVFALMSISKFSAKTRFIIAGDPKQIPPVLDIPDSELDQEDISEMNIYTMLQIHSFDPKEQQLRSVDSITNLDTQYRSVEAIGQLFSHISYDSRLKHGRDLTEFPVKPLPNKIAAILPGAINFINIPLNNKNAIFEKRKLLYSSYHLYAGILTAELLSFFDSQNDELREWSVGIIAPYKAQAMVTGRLIRAKNISPKLNIICDTVHSFQGDQCDIVIFIVNPNNWYFSGHEKSLLSKEYIYNVAISRARDYLWILNPYDDLTNPHVEKILKTNNTVNNRKEVLKPGMLEKLMFGKSNYLEGHCFVTGHDNINIFGSSSEMKYFIRTNETAIDVQISEKLRPEEE